MIVVLFGAAVAAVIVGGLAAVLSKDLVRAIMAFGVALAGMAGLYGLLEAPYLAAIQLLVYVGGVLTVVVFGVLLTRRPAEERVLVTRGRVLPAVLAALAFAVPVGVAILTSPAASASGARVEPTAALGTLFIGEHLLAFEVLSVVLLVAMIGAILLARRVDPGAGRKEAP